MSSGNLKKVKPRATFVNVAGVKISNVIIIINRTKLHAPQTASVLKVFLDREKVSYLLFPGRHLVNTRFQESSEKPVH